MKIVPSVPFVVTLITALVVGTPVFALSERAQELLDEIRARQPKAAEVSDAQEVDGKEVARQGADVIVLRNGDRLSGLVLGMSDGLYELRAHGNERVQLPADEVVSLRTAGGYRVTLVGGSALDGPLEPRDDERVAVLTEVGPVEVQLDQISKVEDFADIERRRRQREEQLRFDLSDVWSGRTTLGVTNVSGNTSSTNVAMAFEATRRSPADRLYIDGRYNRATAADVVSADVVRGGMRLDVNISPRLFYFLFGRLEIDKVMELDLRTTVGAGLGRTFYNEPKRQLDVGFGATYNRDAYENLPRATETTFLLSVNWSGTIGENATFSERLLYYPTFSDFSDYRIESETKFDYFLQDDLSLTVTILNRYDSTPPSGKESNDLTVTTGLTKRF